MDALIGALTALVVVTVDRHLERRQSSHDWLRSEILSAGADLMSAYQRTIDTLTGFDSTDFSGIEVLGEHLVTFANGGRREVAAASYRLTALGDQRLVAAAHALGHHLDRCFNSFHDPAMRIGTRRDLIFSGEPFLDILIGELRNALRVRRLELPMSTFYKRREKREDLFG